jgi:predicted CXXCH cytochrome family protein
MAQIFGRNSNWLARTSLVAIFALAIGAVGAALAIDRSGYVTDVDRFVDQPVPFSHQHHVTELGVDCRYCHNQVESGAYAQIPPVQVCMTCHKQIWYNSPLLAPIRNSYATGEPVIWNKVTRLPHYVYFNHSIHIAKGVGCVSCHGDVGSMPLTRLAHPMQMQFCTTCHKNPELYVRPQDEIYQRDSTATQDIRNQIVRERHVQSKMDCVTCHR